MTTPATSRTASPDPARGNSYNALDLRADRLHGRHPVRRLFRRPTPQEVNR